MQEYLIETIFPCGEIHLVGGPTGAGKTRWLLDMLLAWQQGKSVLDYKSYPCPWLYVSSDRSEKSVLRTLKTMQIDPTKIPMLSAMDKRLTLSQILDCVQERAAKLVVIESFGNFVDPPGLGVQVRNFFYSLRPILNQAELTIIGVMESPKMKPKDKYENPRQRISGVATWGHYADTIVLVEPMNAKKANSNRMLTVCPRNAPEQHIESTFIDGHLVPTADLSPLVSK